MPAVLGLGSELRAGSPSVARGGDWFWGSYSPSPTLSPRGVFPFCPLLSGAWLLWWSHWVLRNSQVPSVLGRQGKPQRRERSWVQRLGKEKREQALHPPLGPPWFSHWREGELSPWEPGQV